ncbi:MAG TPA: response regulator [Burkholderiales bacterium]|nr:response regulator [Burkholderiales bacterium]
MPAGPQATHVLVIHHDRDLRELLKRHLAGAGYAVTSLKDPGDIGVQLARRGTDLVVVDMGLPYIDGVEFFVSQPDGQLIPVVFLTDDDKTRARAERLGAVACLTKPMYADAFLGAVARALRERENFGLRAGIRPAGSCGVLAAG